MENPPTPPVRPDEPSSGPVPNRSKMRRAIVWIVVLLVFAGLFLLVLRTQNTPQAAAQTGKRAATSGAVSVIPATAQKGNIGVYLEAIGTVTPVYTSSVTSQVTGLVMAVHYREGQLVHKGDALIDIDPRPFQAQLAQAQGTLEKDTQTLAQARWTWSAIAQPGPGTRSPSRSWTTRKRSCCRIRDR